MMTKGALVLAIVVLGIVAPAAAQVTGTPCTLSVYVKSDKTQVEKDQKATLTATVSNSGDEACTGTTLSSTATPSTGATVTWTSTSGNVPAKGSWDVVGSFSASAAGSYTVTVYATRGTATANGAATIGVGTAQSASSTCGASFAVDNYFINSGETSTTTISFANGGSGTCSISISTLPPAGAVMSCDKSTLSIGAYGKATVKCAFQSNTARDNRFVIQMTGTGTPQQGIVITVRPRVGVDPIPDMIIPEGSSSASLSASGTTNEADGTSVKITLARSGTGTIIDETRVNAQGGKFTYSKTIGPGKYTLTARSEWADCSNERAVTCYSGYKDFEVFSPEALRPSPTSTPTPASGCDGRPQGARRCSGNFLQQCSADNVWRSSEECPYGCDAGACKTAPPSTPAPSQPVVQPPKVTPGFEGVLAVVAIGAVALWVRRR